ncbi:hypothetical protein [Streptomyces niveiscabiei]|uniref:Uncharacterized protein n=1 Tax=Streptomyces niveiscabiei TaxID=164115 RepID=A0ABW9HM50_9ACTN
MDNAEITIKLTSDEALVLSDWLELDRALPGIFAADYAESLDAARHHLRETMSSPTEDQDS